MNVNVIIINKFNKQLYTYNKTFDNNRGRSNLFFNIVYNVHKKLIPQLL